MSKKKGLIYCPHFEEDNGDIYIPHVQIQDSQMQFFCLYWDYIIQPISAQLPRWKSSINERVLEEAGILIKDYQEIPEYEQKLYVRENAYSLKSEGAKHWISAFREFQYKSLNKALKHRPDVIWTPQQSFRELTASPNRAKDVHCIQLLLHKKLPVPSNTASIKKIVQFKYENKDLFRELKLSMDKLTDFVAKAGVDNEY